MTKELTAHPAADVFPPMDDDEFDALVKDIEEHGQREPITLLDGQILDGRNRYRALRQLDIEPRYVHWQSDGDPNAYVISKNIHRRHLTASQRAMLVARLVNLKPGQAKRRINMFGSGTDVTTSDAVTYQEAADIAQVARSSVIDAKTIQEQGTPEQIEAVNKGDSGLRPMANHIRKDAKKLPKPKGRTRESYRDKSKYWRECRKGIDVLVGLPEPLDVLNSIPAPQWERYGPRFAAVAKWMTTFMELYNDSHRNESRRDA